MFLQPIEPQKSNKDKSHKTEEDSKPSGIDYSETLKGFGRAINSGSDTPPAQLMVEEDEELKQGKLVQRMPEEGLKHGKPEEEPLLRAKTAQQKPLEGGFLQRKTAQRKPEEELKQGKLVQRKPEEALQQGKTEEEGLLRAKTAQQKPLEGGFLQRKTVQKQATEEEVSQAKKIANSQAVDVSGKGNEVQKKEDEDKLRVNEGQLTFDAEGNDTEDSRYFTRKAHWPGYNSGVTIGRGYDLGHRGSNETIVEELKEVGIDSSKFSGAIGLKGKNAQTWLTKNSKNLPIITHEQQKSLFKITYNALAKDTKRLATKPDVAKAYGTTNWENLLQPIKEVLVDLRYRGDYTPTTRKFVQTYVANNDLKGFYKVLSDKTKWENVPKDRFERRVNFLKTYVEPSKTQEAKEDKTLVKTEEPSSFITKVARNVYKGMEGSGTDENLVYNSLSLLNNDDTLIREFKKVYKDLYGKNIIDDLKADFSNTFLFGNELDKVLSYLIPRKVAQKEITYYYVVEQNIGNTQIASMFGITRDELENANSELHKKRGGKHYFWASDNIIIPNPTKNKESLNTEKTSKQNTTPVKEAAKVTVENTNVAKNTPIVEDAAPDELENQQQTENSNNVSSSPTAPDVSSINTEQIRNTATEIEAEAQTGESKEAVAANTTTTVGEMADQTSVDASKDVEKLRATFGFKGWIKASVGISMTNSIADVKLVAQALVNKGITGVPDAAVNDGTYSSGLGTAIKNFQKSVGIGQDGKIGAHGGTIRSLLGYSSGMEKIYAGRGTINKVLNKRDFATTLKGDVGKSLSNNTAENNPEDVKAIAASLKAKNIDVPADSLAEGKSSEAFIQSIITYQKKLFKNPGNADGNISKGGYTDKNLSGFAKYSISTLNRSSDGMEYSRGTKSDKYYEAVGALKETLGVEKDSSLDGALGMARKAATDNKYFNELTKSIKEKVIINSEDIAIDGITLSSVLESRMRRFHKFMVAAGLYVGNMQISDGVRSPLKAHKFAVQYHIVNGTHADDIKKNLIKLYNENLSEGVAKDKHGVVWAKKEHFKTDLSGKATEVYYDKVKAYVKTQKYGRSNITSPASAGYSKAPECEPLPIGKTPSNHTKGLALDIDSHRLVNKKEAVIDLIALNFGMVRAGGSKETWHFELSDLGMSAEERKIVDAEER